MVGMLNMDSSPKSGMAITSDKTMKARKLAITTNIENINWERGFISRNARNSIYIDFSGKDNRRMID
jgi:hypothetical protein